MKPLLAHIYEPHRVTYPCYVQPKLNGVRALYQGGYFQSRDELPFPQGLLDHLVQPLMRVYGTHHAPLDGELYVHGWPLQRINAAVTPVRLKPTEDTLQVEYHIFDQVDYGKSFRDRAPRLALPEIDHPAIHYVQTVHCGTEELANELYSEFVSNGYEGMMYRIGCCPYTTPKQVLTPEDNSMERFASRSGFLSDKNNRTWHLLKRKSWLDDEFECVNVIEGEGKYKGSLGALQCAVTKPFTLNEDGSTNHWFFTVGSGITDSDRDFYWQNPPIGKLVKVKYLCLSSDGIPLNPTILAIL